MPTIIEYPTRIVAAAAPSILGESWQTTKASGAAALRVEVTA